MAACFYSIRDRLDYTASMLRVSAKGLNDNTPLVWFAILTNVVLGVASIPGFALMAVAYMNGHVVPVEGRVEQDGICVAPPSDDGPASGLLGKHAHDDPSPDARELALAMGLTHAGAPSDLRILNLRSNNMTGSISALVLGEEMFEIDLRDNRLTGTIPAALTAQAHLRILRLDRNALSGPVPEPLTRWGLHELDISNNLLVTGTFPATLPTMRGLSVLRMVNTSLFGQLPDSMGDMPKLEEINVRFSLLTHNRSAPNSRGELLPEFLTFGTDSIVLRTEQYFGGDGPLECPGMRWVGRGNTPQIIEISSFYTHYQGCRCGEGFRMAFVRTLGNEIILARWSIARSSPMLSADREAFERDFLPEVLPICVSGQADRTNILVATIVPAVALVAIIAGVAFLVMRKSVAAAVMDRRKRAGPPTGHREVTLVLTDVEDSTKLWEDMPEVMAAANAMHDAIMRRNLGRWFGYEVTTEGDSFLLAFHEPADAVGWCLSVQQELMAADWPGELGRGVHVGESSDDTIARARSFLHPLVSRKIDQDVAGASLAEVSGARTEAGDRVSAAGAAQAEGRTVAASRHTVAEVGVEHVAAHRPGVADGTRTEAAAAEADLGEGGPHVFRGLLVRMGVATANATRSKTHKVTRRVEYEGPVMDLVNAIQDVAHGGQVLLCERTLELLARGPITDLYKRVMGLKPAKKLTALLNQIQFGLPAPLSRWNTLAPNGTAKSGALTYMKTFMPVSRDGGRTPPTLGVSRITEDGIQAMGAQAADPAPQAKASRSRVQFQLTSNSSRLIASSQHGAASIHRTAPDGVLWARNTDDGDERTKSQSRDRHGEVIVLDMGEQSLGKKGATHVFQVLVPMLEERARLFPPVEAPVTPTYFHAPGALAPLLPHLSMCPHKTAYIDCSSCWEMASLPNVTIVFCAPCDMDDVMQLGSAKEKVVALYKGAVRYTLPRFNGYECQELNGAFMIAFTHLWQAYLWAASFHALLPTMPWPARMMRARAFAPSCDENGRFVDGGLRVRIGVCEGKPLRVMPHPATGRADYFGPLVNRAARLCFAAARPGQTTGPVEQMGKAVAQMGSQRDTGGFFKLDSESPTGTAWGSMRASVTDLPPPSELQRAAPANTLAADMLTPRPSAMLPRSLSMARKVHTKATPGKPMRAMMASMFEVHADSSLLWMCGTELSQMLASLPVNQNGVRGLRLSVTDKDSLAAHLPPVQTGESAAAGYSSPRVFRPSRFLESGAPVDREAVPVSSAVEAQDTASLPRGPPVLHTSGDDRLERQRTLAKAMRLLSIPRNREGERGSAASGHEEGRSVPGLQPGCHDAGIDALRLGVAESTAEALTVRKSFAIGRFQEAVQRVRSQRRSGRTSTNVVQERRRATKDEPRHKQVAHEPTWIEALVRARVDHVGRFRLKGVQGEFEVGCFATGTRRHPVPAAPDPGSPGKKATLLAPPRGLIVKLQLHLPVASFSELPPSHCGAEVGSDDCASPSAVASGPMPSTPGRGAQVPFPLDESHGPSGLATLASLRPFG
ncbi:unnamed protein product [Pedinophyceae sp. YPF-701]|nr:unnamed protein product [Pedinophyceae sp. YPF-701]